MLGLLTLALALGLMRALDKRQQQQDAARRLAASSQAPSAITLYGQDLFRAEAVELRRSLPFTGTLKAVHSATLKARVAGELRGLSVREGDRVRAGQLLAQVDATEARARLAQDAQLRARVAHDTDTGTRLLRFALGGAVFGAVDALAAKHRLGLRHHLRLIGQRKELLQNFAGHALV